MSKRTQLRRWRHSPTMFRMKTLPALVVLLLVACASSVGGALGAGYYELEAMSDPAACDGHDFERAWFNGPADLARATQMRGVAFPLELEVDDAWRGRSSSIAVDVMPTDAGWRMVIVEGWWTPPLVCGDAADCELKSEQPPSRCDLAGTIW